MTCALCGREIRRAKIAAKQYVYSRHTRNYYCGPSDWRCCCELRRRRRREAAAAEPGA